jgi:2-polyprenyl-3-methyl-5-hydroxy-6-metoxy-1,4-benzoquinol methylase
MKEEEIPSSLEFDFSVIKDLPPRAKILDLGCGNGILCRELAHMGYDVYGVDCSEDGIRAAEEADGNSKYFVMDVSKLTFESSFFDFVVIKAVLTVIPKASSRKQIMRETNRVLKNDGCVYIADFAQTWHNPIYYARYVNNYSKTSEFGLFKVCDEKGDKLYMAKHFNQKEIVELYLNAGFSSLQFDTIKVKTRSGNIIDGYKILLEKVPTENSVNTRL